MSFPECGALAVLSLANPPAYLSPQELEGYLWVGAFLSCIFSVILMIFALQVSPQLFLLNSVHINQLLCAWSCACVHTWYNLILTKHFEVSIIISINKWRKQGSERLGNFLKLTQLASGRNRIQTQDCGLSDSPACLQMWLGYRLYSLAEVWKHKTEAKYNNTKYVTTTT